MKFTSLISVNRKGIKFNYQIDVDSYNDFIEEIKKYENVKWAYLVEVETGLLTAHYDGKTFLTY